MRLRTVPLDIRFADAFAGPLSGSPTSGCCSTWSGQPTLFVRRDEVEAEWDWIDAIRAGLGRQRGGRPSPIPPAAGGRRPRSRWPNATAVTWHENPLSSVTGDAPCLCTPSSPTSPNASAQRSAESRRRYLDLIDARPRRGPATRGPVLRQPRPWLRRRGRQDKDRAARARRAEHRHRHRLQRHALGASALWALSRA